MKKITSILMAIALVAITIFLPLGTVVHAAPKVSISVSKSTVQIGDKVTVTVSVPSGYAASGCVFVKNSSAEWDSTSDQYFSIGDAAGQPASASFSYRAKGEGSATFVAHVSAMGDANGDSINVADASASVKVENQAGSDEKAKSDNNYLKSLVISHGTLSPSFSKRTTEYTATVPNAVTSVSVSATPDDSAGDVISVDGNSGLSIGRNTIKIVVKAENGERRTYTIVITRKEDGDEPEPESETESETESAQEEEKEFTFSGQKLFSAEEIPQEECPEDFDVSTIDIGTRTYPCAEFKNGELYLLYLKAEGQEQGTFYIYDHEQDVVYSFVKITSERGYIIALLPQVDQIPKGYGETTLSIEGKGVVTAYQTEDLLEQNPQSQNNFGLLDWLKPETIYAAEPKAADFYLLYGISNQGEIGWYNYDQVEGTYQRMSFSEVELQTEHDISYEELSNDYYNVKRKFEDYKMKAMFVAAIGIVILLVLVISLIAVVASNRKNHLDDFELDVDELEESEILDEPIRVADAVPEEKPVSAEKQVSVDNQVSDSTTKEKFDTVDLSALSNQIEEQIANHLSDGEVVGDDDDDFTIIDL